MKKSKLFISLAALLLALFLPPQTAEAAGFVQDAAGVKYQNNDGTFLKDNWVQVGQSIYHLDANGYVQFGWIQVGNLWYNMGTDGICQNPNGAAAPAAGTASVSATPAASASAAQPATATATKADTNNIFAAAGWVPFQTSNTALMQHGIATGYIGFDGVSYWAEPTFAATALTAASSPVSTAVASTASNTAATQQTSIALPSQVWLSATGNKYHNINNCGKMNPKRATLVSLEEAQRNYEKCSKCF